MVFLLWVKKMKANITDIKKFAVHDGDGIRTTVFFKGCSLKCVWCHNPETISKQKQIAFYSHKCVMCGACSSVCENHKISDGVHKYDREKCVSCEKCVDVCLAEALILYGKEVESDEICRILMEDKEFYESSNGGITLSGGECLLQPEACRSILYEMKQNGIHTAVDTCGMVSWENIEAVLDLTDIFLFDLKAIDEVVHKKCTGASNHLILENLKKIDAAGKQIEIRIPYVPDYNDNQIDKIVDLVSSLSNLTKVRVLAYHNFADSKYGALGMENTLPKTLPDKEILEVERVKFRRRGITCI